ncbi:hypothetical protein K438DRAFT_1815786 [Mycena galopus ATCC 62051]|nr:hypothetical protein K438DRAFT_1815786 [Mycena galopus ATCC 62051]
MARGLANSSRNQHCLPSQKRKGSNHHREEMREDFQHHHLHPNLPWACQISFSLTSPSWLKMRVVWGRQIRLHPSSKKNHHHHQVVGPSFPSPCAYGIVQMYWPRR